MSLTPEAAAVIALSKAAILADAYNEARKTRLAAQKVADALEIEEKALKASLIENLKAAQATSVGGKTAIVRLVIKNEPQASDMDALYAHIRATGEFELLYRRINPASIKERKDVGVDVPGISWFSVETLSLSQVK
jgi:phosphate uptake regulator